MNVCLLKSAFKEIFLVFILFIYLIIPVKQQFLNAVHFLSHVSLSEEFHHQRDHLHHDSKHNHSFIETIVDILDESQANHPLPVEVLRMDFQPAIPSECLQLPVNYSLSLNKLISSMAEAIITGPHLEVPVPPP